MSSIYINCRFISNQDLSRSRNCQNCDNNHCRFQRNQESDAKHSPSLAFHLIREVHRITMQQKQKSISNTTMMVAKTREKSFEEGSCVTDKCATPYYCKSFPYNHHYYYLQQFAIAIIIIISRQSMQKCRCSSR